MSNIFMSTEYSKTSDPNRLRLYFMDKIDLRDLRVSIQAFHL